MAYYVNSAASSDSLTRDLRELIPAPEMRRRMSRVLKMAVSTAMEALASLPADERVSAIITATRLGCLTDSERFLRSMVEQDDSSPSPTPFIQSTFNTVGGQIAILTRNHCYNTTYVHGGESFAHALLDTAIQIDHCGAAHVLVGVFDEATPTRDRIIERLGTRCSVDAGKDAARDRWNGLSGGDGARFFVISAHPLPGCLARVETSGELIEGRWMQGL